MSKIYGLSLMLVVALVASSPSGFAQRITFGGQSITVENDDEDRDNNQGNRSGTRSQNSNNSNSNNFQQSFPGQGNQGQNQGGQNQFRRSNQQSQFQGQQFQGQQQFQNWQQQSGKGGLSIGTWQGGKWQGSNKIDNWTKAYGGEQKPFSSQWYQKHPKAWKYDNNNANVWVTASVPGLYGWLGWGDVPREYRVNYGSVQAFDHSHFGEWYPLGVYSLMAGPDDSGTRIVQLAVDRHGHLAGNYYDMITNSNYSVSGDISRQSQRASFSLNKNKFIRFRAPIYELLQPYGSLSVQLPGGQQQWQFVRLEN